MNHQRDKAVASVQIDNDRVVVTEWRFSPGAETTWHRHAYDYIVVPQTSGQLLIESAEGQALSELSTGVAYMRSAGVEHNVINQNQHEFVFVEIELK